MKRTAITILALGVLLGGLCAEVLSDHPAAKKEFVAQFKAMEVAKWQVNIGDSAWFRMPASNQVTHVRMLYQEIEYGLAGFGNMEFQAQRTIVQDADGTVLATWERGQVPATFKVPRSALCRITTVVEIGAGAVKAPVAGYLLGYR
jgi:hypothetical protein